MKNVQIWDGADNVTLSIFRATESEFSYLFPGSGQDIEIIEDFIARHHESHVAEVLNNLWLRPIHKSKADGIHGTLFYNYADKRHHLPASKREIDRDLSQINQAERELYARMREDEQAETDIPLPITTAELLGEIPGGQQLLEWFSAAIASACCCTQACAWCSVVASAHCSAWFRSHCSVAVSARRCARACWHCSNAAPAAD